MKVKTSELIGAQLDWAVDEAQGFGDMYLKFWNMGGDKRFTHCEIMRHYSGHWDQAGPIIEREGVMLNVELGTKKQIKYWWADNVRYDKDCYQTGPTPLIAAMRCYVNSKLGDEVDVPEELK